MCFTSLVLDSICSKISKMAAIRRPRSVVMGNWNYFELTHSQQIKYMYIEVALEAYFKIANTITSTFIHTPG